MTYRRKASGKNPPAFTLIELLIVIGIVGVIAFLLSGAYSKSIATAKRQGCSQNLRNIGIACFSYAADNNGNLPIRYVESTPSNWGGYGDPLWYLPLAPYAGVEVTIAAKGELNTPGPFKCPADAIPWVAGNPDQYKPSCSYSFPHSLAYYISSGVANQNGTFVNLNTRFKVRFEAVLLVDSAYGNTFNVFSYWSAGAPGNAPEKTGPVFMKRHNGLMALFADGHCEFLPGITPTSNPARPLLWSL